MGKEIQANGAGLVLDFSGVDVSKIETAESNKILKVDGSNANVAKVAIDDSFYKDNLPEGISIDTVQKVNKYNKEYLKTVAKSSVDFGATVLEKNKEVDSVVFVAPFMAEGITKTSSLVTVQVDRLKKIVAPGQEPVFRPGFKMNVKTKHTIGNTLETDLKTLLQERIK